jgi:hypothetical protein
LPNETLPIIKKTKAPKNEENNEKITRPMSKKTNEPPKRANHKGNIKFPNFLKS